MIDLINSIPPVLIVWVGAFVSICVVMYYLVKDTAMRKGIEEADKYNFEKETKKQLVTKIKPPYYENTIMFRNGATTMMNGVKLIITTNHDENEIIGIDFEPSDDPSVVAGYDTDISFLDYSEIMMITTKTR